jgi:MYXO-CTERM domain-containing protein
MRPVIDIAEIQAQRGQALRIPHREVQVLRGLGEAKGPATPQPPLTSASSESSMPWWAWALLGAGVLAFLVRKDS